jgi:alkanesulfonate monooxygenase SsuD/methylene tetrahydromethanopterin reductase-like flavin-dependent oxidoreductase (luciferase family)
MTAATFRNPAMLAATVAQVDEMSGGRVDFGIGAGWHEAEHSAFAIPFPPTRERFERLEEQLQIITGMWQAEGAFDFEGRHYSLHGNPGLPKPQQLPHPPILVGGFGPRRTPRLAARYAAEYNMFAPTAPQFDERVAGARAACAETGRDPESLRLSVVQTVACGRDEDEARRRAARIGRNLEDMRAGNAAGTPAQVVERLRGWAARGVVRVYLQLLDIDDLDQVRLIGRQVLPALS